MHNKVYRQTYECSDKIVLFYLDRHDTDKNGINSAGVTYYKYHNIVQLHGNVYI